MDVILDDRLLVEELLVGVDRRRWPAEPGLHTTTYWYYRACRAAVVGAGGHLSGPFEGVGREDQERAIAAMLRLPPEIGLPDPRITVPLMAEVATRHPRLNLLNLEVVAHARATGATVWTSPETATGVLPVVLEAEGLPWETMAIW
ncbi:MAG TPA: hypothetical protein VHW47_08505 [Acidimicrobiales bacterium]|nr:hypothetical protein [Acidimicrobiales bacterium]